MGFSSQLLAGMEDISPSQVVPTMAESQSPMATQGDVLQEPGANSLLMSLGYVGI